MNAIISAKGLTKRYGRTLAVDHIDLEIPPGRIVGLVGPNGAGKTTALKAILGLATLTRPYAVLMPAVVIALVTGATWPHRLRQMGLAYVTLVAVVLPWSIRNDQVLGGMVPVSTNAARPSSTIR